MIDYERRAMLRWIEDGRRVVHDSQSAIEWFGRLGYAEEEILAAFDKAIWGQATCHLLEIFSRHGYRAPTMAQLVLRDLQAA